MNFFILCCLLFVGCTAASNVIPGEFILRLEEDRISTEAKQEELIEYLKINFDFELIKKLSAGKLRFLHLKGNAKWMSNINAIPGVKYIEENSKAVLYQNCQEQPSPGTWSLDRVDQRDPLSYDDPSSPDATYIYGGSNTGSDVMVYVVDSGIEVDHPDFEGRAIWGYAAPGEPDYDDVGHGTESAGAVGSRNHGVAKEAQLMSVKVVGASGGGSGVDAFVSGMEWVIEHHITRRNDLGEEPKSIATASLGYGERQAVDDVVQETIDEGIPVVAAAGNGNSDACLSSPGRVPDVITVGATDISDTTAVFTDFGTCVDIFAPGVNVLTTYLDGKDLVTSGTSIACPLVTGAIARYMSSLPGAPTVEQVDAWLKDQATMGALSWRHDKHSSSPNALLYTECS